MQALTSLLNQPEYAHVLTNHFPLVGLLVAMGALGAALAARNRVATIIGLALVGLLSLSAWPVYHYGEAGYDRVLSMTDEAGAAYLNYHKELAERWVFLYFVTAGVAGVGLAAARKWPASLPFTSVLALVFAALSLAAGVFVARAGGEIRHREFRQGSPPPHHEQAP